MNRAADVALAGLGLVVTSPLLVAAGLAVKLEDGGPVLFRQTRVGKDGKDFELLKLRSMVVDAERTGAGHAVDRGDRRITRVGRLLRRTSIDELPQLWNIVRGDMSVIGPRPTLRYQVERYTRTAAAEARRPARAHRLGADPRPGDAPVGGADRAGRVVRRAPLAPCRPADPAADPACPVRRHVQGGDRRMARGGMTERRAARLGLVGALVVVLAQLVVASAWSLTHDDPTLLDLTRRCLEREKGLVVEATTGDRVAASAGGGTLRTVVEGGLVTIALATSEAEAERLRAAYAAGDPGPRLDVHGRYVALWLRPPSPTQRQVTYDCAY